jgi:hypothetical protein
LNKKINNYVKIEELLEAAAWQKSSGKNKNGGLNKKGVDSYRREHPGSKLQTAVTTKPSKLKKGSKASKRRKSFCARMKGMKKHRTGAKTAHDPNSRINKSLRKWHCESAEQMRELIDLAEAYINETKQRLDPKCWTGYHKDGTKMKGGVRVNNCVPNEDVDEAANAAQQAAIAIAKKKEKNVAENFADGKGPRDIAAEFMADPIGKKYAKADCKTSTRAFVKWAEAKGLKPETMNLAPPSQGMLDKRSELLQDGQGAGHIFPVVNGYGIDFTATQFPGITEIPLITPVSQIPSLYKRIGGYFTDAPEWMDNRTSWLGPWDKIPADVMKDRDFADEYFKENFADGKGPGRPGDSARHGIPKHATMSELEKASHADGRKGQLARWQLNMRNGKS